MISRKTLANAIRILSIDAIQKANSGHPGMPLGMADIAEVLWRDYMNHNPQNPNWINRDRFIISNGHGAMLLYSLLHLTGYNVSIQDLKNFRQLHSKTPGHPEYGVTAGVETTTGPLGQGIANAVGMAIAERTLSAQFNKKQFNIIDHYTYVFLGDGCMMEGISHEVCSLAGKLQLNKLIAFYDDNNVSIDGNVQEWYSEDTAKRFESYGWHVIPNIDGHNSNFIKKSIEDAKSVLDKPSLIICKTIIAFGSPNKSGSHIAHGSPLGAEEVYLTKKTLKWEHPAFTIPKDIYDHWDAKISGKNKEDHWKKIFSEYEITHPKLAEELKRRINKQLPKSWNTYIQKIITSFKKSNQKIATRKASQNILEIIGPILPELIGGSADLTPSNLTNWSGSIPITKNISGNYIHYGVREFGMTAIANGISIYGGFLPYTSTFLTFTGYTQNAIRMAALMKIRHIMIYTHDSIGLGEDGPTHQPIEHLSSLRMIPNLNIWRPCDHIETAISWKFAVENSNTPTVLILSRQNLHSQEYSTSQIENISKGGYILKDCINNTPELIIIATGSEITLAVKAYHQLTQEGHQIRVVSIPSTNTFDIQNQEYKNFVLPLHITNRIAIEASSHDYWHKYVGLNGKIIGMKTFGKSAPSKDLFKFFKFTVDTIIQNAYHLLNK